MSSIQLAKNPVLHGRSKHIETRYHFLREQVEQKIVEVVYCPTGEQVADIFTKALKAETFDMEYWSFEAIVILSGLLPNPKLETSTMSSCTRVSNELGARNPRAAKLAIFIILVIGTVEAMLLGMTIILMRNTWGQLVSKDKEVISHMASVMPLVAVVQIIDAYQCVFAGIVRGCGWQNICTVINLGSFYGVGLPISVLLAFKFHMGGKARKAVERIQNLSAMGDVTNPSLPQRLDINDLQSIEFQSKDKTFEMEASISGVGILAEDANEKSWRRGNYANMMRRKRERLTPARDFSPEALAGGRHLARAARAKGGLAGPVLPQERRSRRSCRSRGEGCSRHLSQVRRKRERLTPARDFSPEALAGGRHLARAARAKGGLAGPVSPQERRSRRSCRSRGEGCSRHLSQNRERDRERRNARDREREILIGLPQGISRRKYFLAANLLREVSPKPRSRPLLSPGCSRRHSRQDSRCRGLVGLALAGAISPP
ncbi:MATE efflux family protein 7 [Platanthera zijinensis]|uniref:Protein DETOXIFICATION n=1 Tax=Platanthera zijinensis TaxID=2320716 RepID=A0AAP0ASQ6_9ASPA